MASEGKMKTSNLKKTTALALVLVMFLLTVIPGQRALATDSGKINISLVGKYDSADTAAIRDIDLEGRFIRLRNHTTGKTYTLSYDNTSMMYDKRGVVLSPALLEVGQIVDVTFLKSTKHVTTLDVSDEAWEIEDTRDHDFVRSDGVSKIHGEPYNLDARTLVIADGEPALAEDILSTDRVTVRGIGHDIYSVIVTGGHGYVSLSSDTVEDHSLVGAWFELDNEVIYKISPNMLLSAPEGDYTMQILGNGANYQQPVSISRNKETVVDTSNVTITKPKEGLVTFEITPSDAEVFVDGQKILTDVPQSVRYGYHSLKIMADGYVTQDRYLKVGTPKSVVRIELEKDTSADASSSSSSGAGVSTGDVSDQASNKKSVGKSTGEIDAGKKSSAAASTASTISGNSSDKDKPSQNKVIKGHKIYVDAPYNAELYMDGKYIGLIPCSFQKVSGTHEVILKRDGYETKSYRISVDTEETDLNYSFPELKKIKKDDGSSSDSSKDSSSSSEASSEASSEDSGDDSSSDRGSSASSEGSSEESDPSSAASEVTTPPKGPSEGDEPGESSSSEEENDAASTASGD
ncbi:MAG: PEGA domain-containing protein [Butyrivibrio sp.]|nr:PEGA domain-containing protein [Butyrivibrio sp.]